MQRGETCRLALNRRYQRFKCSLSVLHWKIKRFGRCRHFRWSAVSCSRWQSFKEFNHPSDLRRVGNGSGTVKEGAAIADSTESTQTSRINDDLPISRCIQRRTLSSRRLCGAWSLQPLAVAHRSDLTCFAHCNKACEKILPYGVLGLLVNNALEGDATGLLRGLAISH